MKAQIVFWLIRQVYLREFFHEDKNYLLTIREILCLGIFLKVHVFQTFFKPAFLKSYFPFYQNEFATLINFKLAELQKSWIYNTIV